MAEQLPPLWELTAALLSLCYLGLVIRRNSLAWPCALASTLIYTAVFWSVSLMMDSLLNAYYALMAVYGWWCWRRSDEAPQRGIQRWSWRQHALLTGAVVVASLLSGQFLQRFSEAAWPYLDSFTTWGALVATWLVVRKVYENWYYWLAIDSVALFLYIERGLYFTAGLFAIYLVMIVFGIRSWRHEIRQTSATPVPEKISELEPGAP